MSRVLLLGMYRFPHGDAPSNRLLSMAKSLKAAGLDPFVIGNGIRLPYNFDSFTDLYVCEGIPYSTVRSQQESTHGRALRRIFQTYFIAREVKRIGLDQVICIVTTQGTLTLGLVLWSKFIWKKPLIVDCMEWFEPGQFKFGRWSREYILFIFKFHVLCRSIRNVIGITKLLNLHFSALGKKTFRLPPQVDSSEFDSHIDVNTLSRVELFYAGTAAGKDHLGTALRGLMALSVTERQRFRFSIAGPTTDQINALITQDKNSCGDLGSSLRILGRISREQVLAELRSAHFTVLLRPVSRYSSAGFPSKIPESLAAGTPVMTNLTSDLVDYLTDGVDSIIVSDCTPEAFTAALRHVLTLDVSDLNRMFFGAKRCAEKNFDYRILSAQLGKFIKIAT